MKFLISYCAFFFIVAVESRWLLDRICDYELADPHGLITSPNYPHSYPSSIVCTYKIIQQREKVISLGLSHIDLGWNDTHSCSGRLEIYDGDDDLAPRLETFCGTDYFIPSRLINSTANALFIKLESYSSSRGNIGFQSLYKTTDLQCGGLFKENNGSIKHPTHGTQYKNNENCNWIIQAPPGHTVKLQFMTLQTQSGVDVVKISELYEGRIVDLRTISGSVVPPTPIVTRGIGARRGTFVYKSPGPRERLSRSPIIHHHGDGGSGILCLIRCTVSLHGKIRAPLPSTFTAAISSLQGSSGPIVKNTASYANRDESLGYRRHHSTHSVPHNKPTLTCK